MKRIAQCALLFSLFIVALLSEQPHENKFWKLMQKDKSKEHQQVLDSKNWRQFETLFMKYHHNKQNLLNENITRIPHMIHFIWLGTPLPDFSRKMIESWKKFHPDWEIKLWTDADLQTFDLKNREAYNRANNWGEKSDIFRYEILLRYGGLYVDAADFECIRSFDQLHDSCDFFVGIAYGRRGVVYNGLIGCAPNHPIMQQCVDSIRSGNGDNSRWRIVNATGPYFLTKCIKKALANPKAQKKMGVVVTFPSIFFYPFPDSERTKYSDIETVKNEFLCEESLAIHYWKSSWDAQP
jgi:mannosyltransferase OCH1-like enzyme